MLMSIGGTVYYWAYATVVKCFRLAGIQLACFVFMPVILVRDGEHKQFIHTAVIFVTSIYTYFLMDINGEKLIYCKPLKIGYTFIYLFSPIYLFIALKLKCCQNYTLYTYIIQTHLKC